MSGSNLRSASGRAGATIDGVVTSALNEAEGRGKGGQGQSAKFLYAGQDLYSDQDHTGCAPRSSLRSVSIAPVSEATPRIVMTCSNVFARMRRSRPKDQCATYHTSLASRSFQGIALRPVTCAQPVIPGLTACRAFSVSVK